MKAKDDGRRGATSTSTPLGGMLAFAGIWFGLLWLMIIVLAAHAYSVGQASPFRYVGF